MTPDFFRARLGEMVNHEDPLVILSRQMPWDEIEAYLSQFFVRQPKPGTVAEVNDLFGTHAQCLGSGVSPAGRKRLPIRLMASLLYLAYRDNHSDEAVVQRWSESVPYQHFSGGDAAYYEHRKPCDATQIGRFRRAIGEDGVEYLLKVTLQVAVRVGSRTFPGNPYDGHTLNEQLEQTTILLEGIAPPPKTAYVDLGYRGVDRDNPGVEIIHRGKRNSLTHSQWLALRRRQAIEPTIGHLKSDHRLDRCWLKGDLGDALHAVLCAVGYNLRWLLRAIASRSPTPIFLCLIAQLLNQLKNERPRVNRHSGAGFRWAFAGF